MPLTDSDSFEVRHRPDFRGRWRRIAKTATFAEAVALICSRGDWNIRAARAAPPEDESLSAARTRGEVRLGLLLDFLGGVGRGGPHGRVLREFETLHGGEDRE